MRSAKLRRQCRRRSPPRTARGPGALLELGPPTRAARPRARPRGRATRRGCPPEFRTAETSSRAWPCAASISAAPSGAPCVASVPCLFGAPKPITVRQAIIVGRSCALASAIAASIAAGSWPSTAIVCQPAASKRARWSRLVESEVEPSMVIWLSSHSTMRRESRRWPARSMASWLTPSIRHPSPAMT